MDCHCGVHYEWTKEDIIIYCRYCRKDDRKGFGFDHAYGYRCLIGKRQKRRANRCKHCYFGDHRL